MAGLDDPVTFEARSLWIDSSLPAEFLQNLSTSTRHGPKLGRARLWAEGGCACSRPKTLAVLAFAGAKAESVPSWAFALGRGLAKCLRCAEAASVP